MSYHPAESACAEIRVAGVEESVEQLGRVEKLRQQSRELFADLFDRDGLSGIFAHARNVITCSMIMAAGFYAVRHQERVSLPGMWTVHAAGYIVAAIGAVLLLLNLIDGLRKLSRRKHSTLLRALAIYIYVGFSLRLTQVFLYFRVGP